MHRNNLRQLLLSYQSTQQETVYKERMLEFLNMHHDAFERSLAVGHFTASAWLLNADQSQALLMHHAKLNLWVQLGGHADGCTDLLAVAVKEAQEESGIMNIVPVADTIFDIDIHTIPANSKEAQHEHFDVRFLLKVVGDEQFVQNRESKELRWIGKNIEELPTDARSVVRMFEKWQQLP